MGFIDSHAHLHFDEFDADRGEVIDRATRAGIDQFVNIGTDVASSKKSMELAQAYPQIWATAGIHPHDAKEATEQSFRDLEAMLASPRVVAIGEVGLDFYRNLSSHEVQIEVLRKFLELAVRTKKPLVIHCRDAYAELFKLIKEVLKPPCEGILHCYSADVKTMTDYLDLGFYISFAGPLTYKKNDALREACRACPLDRVILETDCPFLPPQTKRGQRNEPRFLLETAQTAADLHGLSLDQLAEKTSSNTRHAFKLC